MRLVVIDDMAHWTYDDEITACGIALRDVPHDRLGGSASRRCEWCAESVADEDDALKEEPVVDARERGSACRSP